MSRTLKIENHPFESINLLSEIHFGQIVSSFRRNLHTILKSDNVDTFCVPTTFADYTPINKFEINKNNNQNQNNSISEKRKSSDTEMNIDSNDNNKNESMSDLLYLVAKYEKNQLSKRDMQFLLKVRTILLKSLTVVNSRKIRAENQNKMIKKIISYKNENINSIDLVKNSIVEIDSTFNCTTMLYVLHPELNPCVRCFL